jgi:DNA adenine methylase
VEWLIELLAYHQAHHSKEYYYQVRSQHQLSPLENAARLIYLNKTCFNGLYRENAKGEFNVPIGRYDNPRICVPEGLRVASKALQTAEVLIRPFDAILQDAQGPEDFVYFDPPYYPLSSTSNFIHYSRHTFLAEQHIQLRDVFLTLAQRGVKVMLSNSDCKFIRDLYGQINAKVEVILASRSVNSKADRRGKIPELIILANL